MEPEENQGSAGEALPQEEASPSANGQPVDYTDAPPQWGTLGLDTQNDQQLGPGPVGPMPAGWPLQPIGLGVPALGPVSPLELTSVTRQDDPSAGPLPAPESRFEPPPEVVPVELTQHEAQPQLSSLELQSPAAPEVVPLGAPAALSVPEVSGLQLSSSEAAPVEPIQVGQYPAAPEVAPLSISSVEQPESPSPISLSERAPPEPVEPVALSTVAEPESLPLIQTSQNSPVEALTELSAGRSDPPAELNPPEISVPQIEDLEPLLVSTQGPEALPGTSLPEPPQLQDLPPLQLGTPQLQDLPPLQLGTPQLQDLQLLSLPQHDFQEIDVESLLASVQQREEKSFFQLTGNIPLLSEM